MTPQSSEQEAANNGVNSGWHLSFLDMVDEDGRVSDLSLSRSLGPIRTVRALSHPQEQRVNGP